MDSVNVLAKFEIHSFSRSWNNRGYTKNLGSPWLHPRSLFSKNFNGLLFGWTLWMYWPNLKSIAFPVPEIIGATQKNLTWKRSWSRFYKVVARLSVCPSVRPSVRPSVKLWTRKLSYRKDDRAIGPMYRRPENFQESMTTPTATFPEFLMGFCSDWAHKCACKIWNP